MHSMMYKVILTVGTVAYILYRVNEWTIFVVPKSTVFKYMY